MTEQTYSLMTFYQGWKAYQNMLKETLSQLTDEHLTRQVGAFPWTIGQLAQHIIANRVWWFQVWMGQGSPDLAPIAHWDPQDVVYSGPVSVAELVEGLDRTWVMVAESLSRWTGDDLSQMFSPPLAMSEEERKDWNDLSRQWIIWHMMEHEIHHGGELSLALGSYGLSGIYGGA